MGKFKKTDKCVAFGPHLTWQVAEVTKHNLMLKVAPSASDVSHSEQTYGNRYFDYFITGSLLAKPFAAISSPGIPVKITLRKMFIK